MLLSPQIQSGRTWIARAAGPTANVSHENYDTCVGPCQPLAGLGRASAPTGPRDAGAGGAGAGPVAEGGCRINETTTCRQWLAFPESCASFCTRPPLGRIRACGRKGAPSPGTISGAFLTFIFMD